MMSRPHLGTLLVGLTVAFCGTLAMKSGLIYQSTLSYRRYIAMSQLLHLQEERTAALQSEIHSTRAEDRSTVSRSVVSSLKRQLAMARVAAGMDVVLGRGLEIRLSDSPIQGGANEQDYLVHDIDLIALVNALNGSGAKAVSINGQRIVATSDIHCAGPVISVNGVRTAPPITILAVGDPSRMTRRINQIGGIVSELEAYDLPVQIIPEERVLVPAYVPPAKEGS